MGKGSTSPNRGAIPSIAYRGAIGKGGGFGRFGCGVGCNFSQNQLLRKSTIEKVYFFISMK